MKKLIFSLSFLFVVIPCQARIITVDDDGPAEFINIQAAIDDANNGDVVEVQPGIYTGPGNRDIDFKGKAITVRSTDPNNPNIVAATIVNCKGTTAEPHRGFYFHSGEDGNSVISGFTITNGIAYIGGCIYCKNSSPTIQNNIISGNRAIWDGVEIPGAGGGIYFENSSAIITGNVITNNSAEGIGGGMFGLHSLITLSNNLISKNHAYEVYGWFSSSGEGGGISCHFYSSFIMINNTISGNYAHDLPFPWQIPGVGGGIFCNNSSLILVNTILWGDSPDEIYTDGATIINYSDIQGGWIGEGNINVNPLFANVANGDYHLKSHAGRWDSNSQSWVYDEVTSPCIDAGNPGCPVGDEPEPNGNRINMGAYGGTAEASKTPTNWRSIADLTNDWAVDFNDLKVFVNYWLDTGPCIPGDLNRNQSIDFSDFAIFALRWSAPFPKPGITYQIEPCNHGASWLLASEQSSQTRFTVTVEGRYMHFEDMMVANCCATELWLEMTVEGNLITICENEEGGFCFCICNYPVTATLGPFEPGTYILDVYEDYGGFIGTTVVTIGAAQ